MFESRCCLPVLPPSFHLGTLLLTPCACDPLDWRLDCLTSSLANIFKVLDTFYLISFHKVVPTVQKCQFSSNLTKTEYKEMDGGW